MRNDTSSNKSRENNFQETPDKAFKFVIDISVHSLVSYSEASV